MSIPTNGIAQRIANGNPILLVEVTPPQNASPDSMRAITKQWIGKVHAMGISDNRDRVSMSAWAAAILAIAEGMEPIMHITTRDRNRIALVSEALGAQALGIRNLLCTSGSHQTLGAYRASKNVYDIDSIQLLQSLAHLAENAALIGETGGIPGAGPYCLAAVAEPFADPLALQITRLEKKIHAGATLLVTQPVFDLERFNVWWDEVARRGLHEKAAIVAGIQPLSPHDLTAAKGKSGAIRIPEPMRTRMNSAGDPAKQKTAAIEIARETIRELQKIKGLRGFSLLADEDPETALQILDQSGLRSD
jgi:methylenetetrahydrofolate reductase (NADPH)